MKKTIFLFILPFILYVSTTRAQVAPAAKYAEGKTPVGFETEINAFLQQDSAKFPPTGVYLFTGSSTIRLWKNLEDDFREISLIRRGFGGSTMEALNYYTGDIVIPYKPATVIVYEGDNDLIKGITPKAFVAQCDSFIRQVHRALPQTMIWFMSVKPSFARKQYLPEQLATNKLLRKLVKKRPNTGFVDITAVMYDEKGKLRKEFFEADSLHVNKACYRAWADRMKSALGIAR
jgi:lysophospholipase L1-like esterase